MIELFRECLCDNHPSHYRLVIYHEISIEDKSHEEIQNARTGPHTTKEEEADATGGSDPRQERFSSQFRHL